MRSTAGTAIESPCEWLGLVHRTSGYRGPALVVPQALAFAADPKLRVALGVRELAHVSRQKRDTVIAQLRTLADDGWVDRSGQRRGRGAGRGGATTLLTLTLPALLRPSQVPPGGFGKPYGVAPGGLGSTTGVTPERPESSSQVAPGGLGTPPHPPVGVGVGEENPHPHPQTPAPSPFEPVDELDVDEAYEVLAGIRGRWPQLWPVQAKQREDCARQIAAWLAAGWAPEQLVAHIGTPPPPLTIGGPLGFMRSRVPRRIPRPTSPTPTPERFVASGTRDPELAARMAAEARERLRGAS